MILDNKNYYTHYVGLNAGFKKAFDYLIKTDFSTLEIGKHNIDGENLFVIYMSYDTKDAADCKMESHRRYIDIQYMVEGEELIATATLNNQVPTEVYDEAKEVMFYKNDYTTLLKLQAGHFAIFFPHDLHMPCIKADKVSTVKKAVLKIAVDYK